MAKPNGNNNKNLPAKLPSKQLAGLRQGNPGHDGRGTGRWPDAVRIRAQAIFDKAQAIEVMGKIVSGDILEFLGEKDGELVIGQTRNADRISAYRELKDTAGIGSTPPVNIDVQGDVKITVVRVKKLANG